MRPVFDGHHHHHHHHGFDGPVFGDGSGLHQLFGWLPVLPGALLALAVVLLLLRGLAAAPGGSADGPRQALDPIRTRWRAAARAYAATAREFAAYECDPGAVLRRPELADVSRPATGRFVDAFAEAGALATDDYPGAGHAQRFIDAAERAQRAWQAAQEAAERARTARFAPGERALLDQVTALLAVAGDTEHEDERRSAYQRARHRLVELERRTGWRLPRQASGVLERGARGMLTQRPA
ncbi:hypothetical protein [Pseudonocardia asaccharolytica]|uniref:Uncharacterized protein n=1 Tax=Pseudonocardia asaccharolytica DSM 44247 = NBRC 16224 TaxID=1123024 RepID=A0A511CYG6_9PSEU|nr:hypothetical protein [Pseudonocardia asaccharolytica]GEL17507.1 hypothetical protein PA7_13440 [Pseudonocardia asaccharolytica DSM 44247 = NBRC 16224]